MKDNPPKESGHLDAEHYQRVGTNRKYHISYTSQLLQKAEIKIINDILIILFNKPELILIKQLTHQMYYSENSATH